MKRALLWALGGLAAGAAAALGGYRLVGDQAADALDADLSAAPAAGAAFHPRTLTALPEAAQRYLRHAIAPGTPPAPACRLWMNGTMTPAPGRPPVVLAAAETLAPRTGFVWTARATMQGLPVRVRDFYGSGAGGLSVLALGLVPLPAGGAAPDVARSARGRLVAEAVWCPTALTHPDVRWHDAGPDRVSYTLVVDGEPETVTLHLAPDGALRELQMDRWGSPDNDTPRRHAYGFAVEAEGTFAGVTIPTRLTGGWYWGTPAYDPARAASFTVTRYRLAGAA